MDELNQDGYEVSDGYSADGYVESYPDIEVLSDKERISNGINDLSLLLLDGYVLPKSEIDGYVNLIKELAKKFDLESKELPTEKTGESKVVILNRRDIKATESDEKSKKAILLASAKELSKLPKTDSNTLKEALEIAQFANTNRLFTSDTLERDLNNLIAFGINTKSIEYYKANKEELRNFCGRSAVGGERLSWLDALLLSIKKRAYKFSIWGFGLTAAFPEFAKIAESFERRRAKKYNLTLDKMDEITAKIGERPLRKTSLSNMLTKYVNDICAEKSKVSRYALKNRLLKRFNNPAPFGSPAQFLAVDDVTEVEVEFYYYISLLDRRFEKEMAKRTFTGRVSAFFRRVLNWVKPWKKKKKKKTNPPKLIAKTFRRL